MGLVDAEKQPLTAERLADQLMPGLDPIGTREMKDLILKLRDQGKTILMVTHDRSLVERTGRTLVIADGKLVDEIRRRE